MHFIVPFNNMHDCIFPCRQSKIIATANEPWKTETNKMDWNLPITTDRPDLLTQLKWTSVSWEVCLDDWLQQKNVNRWSKFEFQSSHVIENRK